MEQLRKMRLKYGYSCRKMADFLDISDAYYWQLENNKKRLTYQLAIKISSIFGSTPDNIFYDDFVNLFKKKNKSIF